MPSLKISEHREQAALIEWWAYACKGYGVDESLLFAVPNGGLRSKITGARLKAEGVRRGIPDLFLAVPKGCYHGLFVEMKVGRNTPTKEQSRVMHELQTAGYACDVCYDTAEAVRTIEKYMCEGKK